MTLRHLTAGAGLIAALCLIAPPALACDGAQCPVEPQAAPAVQAQPEAEPQAASAPMQLKKFTRRPVASTATRTVKKPDGSYAQIPMTRRAKARPAVAPAAPAAPVDMAETAALAFASLAASQVRVVAAEEINEIDLAADAAVVSTSIEVAQSVQVVGADEINELDRRADAPAAVSLDTLNRTLGQGAAQPEPESGSWFARMLAVLGGAFAAAAAAARFLIG